VVGVAAGTSWADRTESAAELSGSSTVAAAAEPSCAVGTAGCAESLVSALAGGNPPPSEEESTPSSGVADGEPLITMRSTSANCCCSLASASKLSFVELYKLTRLRVSWEASRNEEEEACWNSLATQLQRNGAKSSTKVYWRDRERERGAWLWDDEIQRHDTTNSPLLTRVRELGSTKSGGTLQKSLNTSCFCGARVDTVSLVAEITSIRLLITSAVSSTMRDRNPMGVQRLQEESYERYAAARTRRRNKSRSRKSARETTHRRATRRALPELVEYVHEGVGEMCQREEHLQQVRYTKLVSEVIRFLLHQQVVSLPRKGIHMFHKLINSTLRRRAIQAERLPLKYGNQ
jgi:hypothetical protein